MPVVSWIPAPFPSFPRKREFKPVILALATQGQESNIASSIPPSFKERKMDKMLSHLSAAALSTRPARFCGKAKTHMAGDFSKYSPNLDKCLVWRVATFDFASSCQDGHASISGLPYFSIS